MPEFTVKEVRLPELHLPEIKRDDIVRSLSGVRLPEVDLASARTARLKVPSIAVSSSDVGKLIAAGAAVARLARRTSRRDRMVGLPFRRRSRMPVVRLIQPKRRPSRWPVVLVVAGALALAAWAILRRPAVRQRIDAAARDARERIATMQARDERLDIDKDDDTAGAAGSMATEADGFVHAPNDGGPATPTPLDASDGVEIAAFEEAGKPV